MYHKHTLAKLHWFLNQMLIHIGLTNIKIQPQNKFLHLVELS